MEALGRREELIRLVSEFERTSPLPGFRLRFQSYRAYLEGDYRAAVKAFDEGRLVEDPEARFCDACYFARLQQPQRALELLSQAMEKGYDCHYALLHTAWLDGLRCDSAFQALVDRAAVLDSEARRVFEENGGRQILATG
jgi:hypothetical protein